MSADTVTDKGLGTRNWKTWWADIVIQEVLSVENTSIYYIAINIK